MWRFSSRKFEDSRVIAAAYDTHVFDLSSPAKDSGQICDTQRVIGIGGQSTLDCYIWKNIRGALPKSLRSTGLGKVTSRRPQAFYGAGPPSDDS